MLRRIVATLVVALLGCAPTTPGASDAGSSNVAPAIRDPSFEGPQPNPPSKLLGSPWNLASGCAGRFGTIYPSIATGTGFMPTDGTQYALFSDKGCDAGDRALALDQLNENFGGARTLTFDYEMKATIPSSCQGASASVKLLFTGQGTQVLWTSPSFTTAGDSEQRGETVTLPTLPSLPDPTVCTGACNKLTIQMTSTGGCVAGGDGGINVCPCGQFDFGIDHLQVE